MSVRWKLALTIFATGLITALLVAATMVYALQRFEHVTAYRRGSLFLERVVASYDNLFELHERRPDEFEGWLRSMVLLEPDTQLYLLDAEGRILASSGTRRFGRDFRVKLAPVLAASGRPEAAYVMGDDPERMDADAVVAAQPIRRSVIRATDPVAGYLYLVVHTQQLPEGRWAALRSSFAQPALGLAVAVIAFTSLGATLVVVMVTRPLKRLTGAVATISERGLDERHAPPASAFGALAARADEFGRLTRTFEMLLETLRRQWGELRRLDHFRRQGVSNLSHDLRSPLTATVACLETLEGRWRDRGAGAGSTGDRTEAPTIGAKPQPPTGLADDRRLIEIALRNTRNAARLVRSLGDLAKLDEPEFGLQREVVDLTELLDDIALRFAERAGRQGVELACVPADAPAYARVDVELFERAVANLVDNALKYGSRANRITLSAQRAGGAVVVAVADTGPGIDAEDLPHLFDRYYQSRRSVAPASAEGGRGLGLAIVKRIAELHEGEVEVRSRPGVGTEVVLSIPAAAPEAPCQRTGNP